MSLSGLFLSLERSGSCFIRVPVISERSRCGSAQQNYGRFKVEVVPGVLTVEIIVGSHPEKQTGRENLADVPTFKRLLR